MGLTLTNNLSKLIVAGVYCNWNAAHNPMVLEFQRYDVEITAIQKIGSDYVVTAASTSPKVFDELYAIGDYIYIKTVVYDGLYKILALSHGSPLDAHKCTIEMADYTADEVGSPVNSVIGYCYGSTNADFVSYYINCQLYKEQPVSVLKNTIKVYLNSKGYGFIDLQEYCKVWLNQISSNAITGLNEADTSLSCKFKLSYTEKYTGSSDSYTDVTFFAINGAKQFGDSGASNYKLYQTYVTGSGSSTTAKFLTVLERPRIYVKDGVCLPIDLSVVYANEGSYSPVAFTTYTRVSDTTTEYTALLTSQIDYVNRLNLLRLCTLLGTEPTNILSLAFRLSVAKGTSPIRHFTEIIYLDVIQACSNLFYVRWLNTSGGYTHWGFDVAQELNVETDIQQEISLYKYNLETDKGNRRITDKLIKRSVTGTSSQLTNNQMYALSQMPGTVEWLFNADTLGINNEAEIWLEVNTVNDSTKWNNKRECNEIAVTFELPDLLTQRF